MSAPFISPTQESPSEHGVTRPSYSPLSRAESRQAGVSSAESFFKTGMIDEIVHKSGLPLEYLKWMQYPNLTGLARRDYSDVKLSPEDFILHGLQSSCISIHPAIIQEVQSLPFAHLLRQAVLLRGPNRRTVMLSIAEAAFVQLNGLCELLELIVMMIEHTVREHSAETTRWQLYRQQLTLEETPSHENARPQSSKLRLQQEYKILHPLTSQNTGPPFLKTQTLHLIEDIEGSPLDVEIRAKFNRGIFKSDLDHFWTCYRRNYFSVAYSFTLEPFRNVKFGTLRLRRSGEAGFELIKIQAFAICISCRADGEAGKVVDLL